MQGSLCCQLGVVVCNWGSPWRMQVVCDHHYCGWCRLLSACHGRLHPQVWRGETCSWVCWMTKWLTVMSVSSLEGVLNGFAISLPRSFPSWQYAWTIWQCGSWCWCLSLIISQWSISVLICAMRSWWSPAAWPQHPQVPWGTHGCWCFVSFPVVFCQGRQNLLPWSLSIPLCCM